MTIAYKLLVLGTEIVMQSDKDTWIFTHGSEQLQQARVLGYECQDRYLSERLNLEYPGFTIVSVKAVRVDFPQPHEIAQSLKYEGAFVAERYIDSKVVIAIDNFLDRYQIVKNIRQPWYLYLTKAEYYFYAVMLLIGGAVGWSL